MASPLDSCLNKGTFECPVCGRVDFESCLVFKRHINWHDDQRDYKCLYCGAACSYNEIERCLMENHADKIVSNGQAAAHIVHGSVASSGLPAMDAHHPYCHAGVNETTSAPQTCARFEASPDYPPSELLRAFFRSLDRDTISFWRAFFAQAAASQMAASQMAGPQMPAPQTAAPQASATQQSTFQRSGTQRSTSQASMSLDFVMQDLARQDSATPMTATQTYTPPAMPATASAGNATESGAGQRPVDRSLDPAYLRSLNDDDWLSFYDEVVAHNSSSEK